MEQLQTKYNIAKTLAIFFSIMFLFTLIYLNSKCTQQEEIIANQIATITELTSKFLGTKEEQEFLKQVNKEYHQRHPKDN